MSNQSQGHTHQGQGQVVKVSSKKRCSYAGDLHLIQMRFCSLNIFDSGGGGGGCYWPEHHLVLMVVEVNTSKSLIACSSFFITRRLNTDEILHSNEE